ncbi:MAG: ExbD/TolR family protein [Planctomycetota bacterium]
MAVKLPEPEDTEMNMTPMIDIVFQLIIFFLLSLKFKSVDKRIQSELPKDRGIQATPTIVDELPTLTVKLFRRTVNQDLTQVSDADQRNAFTKIRIENRATIDLPNGEWTGTDANQGGLLGDADRQKAYETKKKQIEQVIKKIWAEQDNNPDIKGEIKTPPPFGQAVPHGDVIMVLDAFLDAGITDVKFEGAMPPVIHRGGGGIITAD